MQAPGQRRSVVMLMCPTREVLLWGLITLGLLPTSPVNAQSKGWKQCGTLVLTWVMPGRGSCRFWPLGCGGADDVPKAVV